MTSGTCPKCGSNEIYTDTNVDGRFSTAGRNLVLAKGGILAPAFVGYDNYFCATCGYIERYVTDPSDRQLIAQNWSRVKPG